MIWKSERIKDSAKVNENNERISKDVLIHAINNVLNENSAYIEENKLGCKEAEDLWNKMLEVFYEEKRRHALKVNSLLKFMTEMDFVKDMIDNVRTQSEAFNNIAASSEEMAAATEDIANFVNSVVEATNSTEKASEEGGKNINKAFEFVNQSFLDVDIINKQMKKVMDKTNKINEIIDIVKEIADETNLLALNAAIEAARAGEQGRGFAVVATEVRNLAEHTKDSIFEIQKNISELKINVEESVEKVEGITVKLNSGKGLVDDAINAMEGINSKIKEVNGSVTQIATNVEEQSAVTANISKEINNLTGVTSELLEQCNDTGKAIFETSNIVNELRLDMVNKNIGINDEQLIDICITDHLIWKWRVYNMLLGYETIDIDKIGTHKDCRLGKWYYSDKSGKYKNEKAFIELENDHICLHELAKEATIAYNNREISQAAMLLEKMKASSKNVINLLNRLKK